MELLRLAFDQKWLNWDPDLDAANLPLYVQGFEAANYSKYEQLTEEDRKWTSYSPFSKDRSATTGALSNMAKPFMTQYQFLTKIPNRCTEHQCLVHHNSHIRCSVMAAGITRRATWRPNWNVLFRLNWPEKDWLNSNPKWLEICNGKIWCLCNTVPAVKNIKLTVMVIQFSDNSILLMNSESGPI